MNYAFRKTKHSYHAEARYLPMYTNFLIHRYRSMQVYTEVQWKESRKLVILAPYAELQSTVTGASDSRFRIHMSESHIIYTTFEGNNHKIISMVKKGSCHLLAKVCTQSTG